MHTKLDAALTFLQRDVGYALLDDVRPRPGGGVRLSRQRGPAPGVAVPKGDRSAKLPKEYGRFVPPQRGNSSLSGGSEELDDHVLKLLHDVFARSGGKLSRSELFEVCRRQPVFQPNGEWDRLFWGIRNSSDREITWEEFRSFYAERSVEPVRVQIPSSASSSREAGVFVLPFSHDWREVLDAKLQQLRVPSRQLMVYDNAGLIVNLFGVGDSSSLLSSGRFPLTIRKKEESPDHLSKEMLHISQLSKDISKYAQYPCDLMLVYRFQHMLYKTVLEDSVRDLYNAANGSSAESLRDGLQEAERTCSTAINHDVLYKTVLQSVRLMHLCDWDYADVVLVLAYASVYFRGTFSSIGKKMSPNEAAHVTALLIYLAHAFLLDETCPLRAWQKHIFRKYCTLKVLDAALFRLFKMRPGFQLRITEEEERTALLGLSGLRSSSRPEGSELQIPYTGTAPPQLNNLATWAPNDTIGSHSDVSPCDANPPNQGGLDGASETSTASTVSRASEARSKAATGQHAQGGRDVNCFNLMQDQLRNPPQV